MGGGTPKAHAVRSLLIGEERAGTATLLGVVRVPGPRASVWGVAGEMRLSVAGASTINQMAPNEEKPPTDPLRDASRGIRLQKAMADAGVGSRRACEELIESGEVEVNGRAVLDLPAWVDPSRDRILVRGRPLPVEERAVHVMLHKPRNVVCTMDDPEGRRTVAELVSHPAAARLFPVGRLDYDSTGLLLMTNDGELANRLTHPRYGVLKTYRATVKGEVAEEALEQLEQGIYLAERREGRTTGAQRAAHVGIRIVYRERTRTILEITLAEGRNRQVRRMLASVGHPVRKLMRIGMGPLSLKGLAIGEWRELTRAELNMLRRASDSGKSAGEKASETRPKRRKDRNGERRETGGRRRPS